MRACIVTGDRHAEWRHWSADVAEGIEGYDIVIHGAAQGIDSIVENVAESIVTQLIPMPAQWDKYGKIAGPYRNKAMLSVLLALRECGYEVRVLAFHADLGASKGTKNMVALATNAGIDVTICEGRYA